MSTFNGIIPEFPLLRIDYFHITSGPAPLACLLSHIHTDHLRGLLTLRSPFIYCTPTTRALLLRLERLPHRLNFARGILEARVQTYRHLKKLLRPVPLDTPTEIELRPGESVRVTALEANHCPGACMWLVEEVRSVEREAREGRGKAVLYTGDIRAERWWVELLGRQGALVPYCVLPGEVAGDGQGKGQGQGQLRVLDKVYLDTSFAVRRGECWAFEGKGEGVRELLGKVEEVEKRQGRGRTRYYFHAWTAGYEEVLVALASFLGSRVHVDEYRYKLYSGLLEGENRDVREAARLVGFREGNRWQDGCLTREDGEEVRIHACEKGMGCDVLKDENVIQIMPIVTRYKGVEYMEMGVGGGHGDLDQVHELELNDLNTVGALVELCQKRLQDRPEVLDKVKKWLADCVQQGATNIKLDTEAFYDALEDGSQTKDLDEIPLDRLITALEKLVSEKKTKTELPSKRITFPYSRHASLEELRMLVAALRPRAVYPNTYEPGMDMDDLFGDLLQEPQVPKTTTATSKEEAAPCATDGSDKANKPGASKETSTSSETQAEQVHAPEKVTPHSATMETPDRVEQIRPQSNQQGDNAPGPTSSTDSKRRKRTRSKDLEVERSIQRRLSAYRSVLESDAAEFTGLDLFSVSGYHNEEKEVEL
ncbi:beta-lactamase-like protein [Elsinoe ampelina]|uniref:Protein artemis n=1 Tax=Elsinoe ampelina TaxID=302913 RepID=A0A6A6G1D0_9PEZI|nr:beta-lactamase-like protein [Elsinoe ampelina]